MKSLNFSSSQSGSSPGVGIPELGAMDLSFGFDNPNFSDRTLLLEIIDTDDHRLRNAERRRCEQLLINPDTTSSPPSRVNTIHINSLILAGRSPFFHKLFSNGMQESEQKHVTVRIEALEEVSFMDLMKYVYSNNLPTTLDALLDLCLIADKFEVVSCLRDCTQALQNLPMTCESASVYLNLPPSLVMSPAVQPLIDAAKKFLVAKFKDLDKFKEEVLDLPLLEFQAIVSSDDLQVTTEIIVYNYVLEWARKHYPDLKERREILKTHLLHLVRFPFMTTTQLTKEVQTCNDIDPELASKIVIRALSSKIETNSHENRCLAWEEGNTTSRQFVERAYKYRPIKVVELHLPHQHCVVYLYLRRDELKRIFPEGTIWFESFQLDGQVSAFFARCCRDAAFGRLNFWLGLYVPKSSTRTDCTVKYEFAVRMKPQEVFYSLFSGSHTFNVTESLKYVGSAEWTTFIGDDSSYFINDILHVRVELAIKK